MFIANFRLKNFIQRVMCVVSEGIDYPMLHPAHEMRKIAAKETVDYIRNSMPTALSFYTSREVLDFALQHATPDGHFLEFGVYRGGTIRYIASRVPSKTIHGFDSFEGLPDEWPSYGIKKGGLSTRKKRPRVPNNVALHIGWFDRTLPEWLKSFHGPVAFAHIDCDLYSSTKTIFDLLSSRIKNNTIIVFDEYFGYPQWKNHEFKAFQEFIKDTGLSYEYLAYAKFQTAVRITS